jgi:hypothetical protein
VAILEAPLLSATVSAKFWNKPVPEAGTVETTQRKPLNCALEVDAHDLPAAADSSGLGRTGARDRNGAEGSGDIHEIGRAGGCTGNPTISPLLLIPSGVVAFGKPGAENEVGVPPLAMVKPRVPFTSAQFPTISPLSLTPVAVVEVAPGTSIEVYVNVVADIGPEKKNDRKRASRTLFTRHPPLHPDS